MVKLPDDAAFAVGLDVILLPNSPILVAVAASFERESSWSMMR